MKVGIRRDVSDTVNDMSWVRWMHCNLKLKRGSLVSWALELDPLGSDTDYINIGKLLYHFIPVFSSMK